LKVCFNETTENNIDGDVTVFENGAENKYLKIKIEANGTVTATNKITNETYRNLNTFVEKGDDGDEYNYSPCVDDQEICLNDTKPTITLIESSPIEVKYRLVYKTMVPEKVVDHHRVAELKELN